MGVVGKKNDPTFALMESTQKIAPWVLVAAGCCLWLVNWWAGRPLFLDEANLARNLFDLGFTDFFLAPLEHQQYAPPLYLAAAKACGEALGYGELTLRLPAMLGGIVCIYGLWQAGKHLGLGWWGMLPLGLLFVNPEALRFVGEVKPYAVDLGVSALLLSMALHPVKKSLLMWGIAGVITVWISLPAVFVLAGIGLANLLCTRGPAPTVESPAKQIFSPGRLRWLIVGACWLLSFALLYVLILRPSINNDYLHDYHAQWFLPLPQRGYPWDQLVMLLETIPRVAFGFTAIAIFFGFATALIGVTRASLYQKLLLTVPLASVILASAFGFYSLMSRLLLFTLPCWWLLAALGSKYVYEQSTLAQYWRYAFVAVWLIVLGGTNVARHFWSPMTFSDSRRLSTGIEPGYKVLPHTSALPAYDYYLRIHPSGNEQVEPPRLDYLKYQSPPGRYVGLYDVLTAKGYRERMELDSIWAAERGCRVRTEAMYRAARVYYDCD